MVFGPSRRVARRTARRTSRRQMAMYGGQQQEYYDDEPEPQYQAPPPQPAEPAQQDYAAELQKLAQLKDAGVLTDEEFEAKKKQILGI
jgi:putative oligomerization/nucleic acid binding protein